MDHTTEATSENMELHELEQERQDRIPNQSTRSDADDVCAERITDDSMVVVSDGEELIGAVSDGQEKINRGHALLDGQLFPFSIQTTRRGKITIRRNTRFYWESEETHIRVTHASVDEDGRLYIRFRETRNTYPRQEWVFTTETIAERIESADLRSDAEINERATELFQEST